MNFKYIHRVFRLTQGNASAFFNKGYIAQLYKGHGINDWQNKHTAQYPTYKGKVQNSTVIQMSVCGGNTEIQRIPCRSGFVGAHIKGAL